MMNFSEGPTPSGNSVFLRPSGDPMELSKEDWNRRYETGETPWDSGRPSQELIRVWTEHGIAPCRALDIGCGTGTNAVWLAQQGFDVTGVDLSPLAIEKAKRKTGSNLKVRFLAADALQLPDLGPPFPFVFDRGLYHHLRRVDIKRFQKTLAHVCCPGGYYLVLAGNADDPDKSDAGPPKVTGAEMLAELEPLFELQQLRAFTFDGVVIEGKAVRPLGWSGLFRRRAGS